MLDGLSSLEIGRLRVSVGYGSHKKGRLLAPVEVGELIKKAMQHNTLEKCADEIHLDKSNIERFVKILELPEKVRHMITWGAPKDAIGFSRAIELVGITDEKDLEVVAGAIIANGLDKLEVRQIRQLLDRSDKQVTECIKEVIGMRKTIDKRYVFMGSIIDSILQKKLNKIPQRRRDAILTDSIREIGLENASGRLGTNFFTLVGGPNFRESMDKIGHETIESKLHEAIDERLANE